ncbi:segregation and condensation protein B [Leptolyngbya valderiana BDU 20041]|nr:SMC-Scp complex subunit ScpB [Geitlerinema sp. CS-897]OAB60461.1 segregation and condensation protein B [Leptolyngbya valderiana BDU 20041]PPT06291.1 Segregation and condensation protein B [Geitlerinema sp. FC II]
MKRLATTIEAILYLKGKALSVSQLTEYTKCDRAEIEDALLELMDDYARRDSALEIVETENGYSLQLREAFREVMLDLVPPEMGVGAQRTLAAIALKQPILQSELVDWRGSGAYQHVKELMELGLVRRRKSPDARSYELRVTPKFHQYFQIESLPLLQ